MVNAAWMPDIPSYVLDMPSYVMPRKYHNMILNRTKSGRYALNLFEHWNKDGTHFVVELCIWPNGTILLDRPDDFWDDTIAFIPSSWEPI